MWGSPHEIEISRLSRELRVFTMSDPGNPGLLVAGNPEISLTLRGNLLIKGTFGISGLSPEKSIVVGYTK
jgi:hypothetical protein